MIVMKKKTVLQELAISLYLMLEFDPDTTASSLVRRIRERAKDALEAAATYTGILGEKDVHDFLRTKPLKFTINCNTDIIKGDIIRFIEIVFDNRKKPPRQLGKRGVTAEVIDMHQMGEDAMLDMRVIVSGGVWDIKPDTEIHRTLKNVARIEVMRTAWDDEGLRQEVKKRNAPHPKTIKGAMEEIFAPPIPAKK